MSMPEERPMAYWLGDKNSDAESFVADIAWVAAILLIAVPIPIGLMLWRLLRSL